MLAVSNGHAASAQALLQGGADVNYITPDSFNAPPERTALACAAVKADAAVIELLLARGASINLKAIGGKTALQHAIENKRHDIADLLRARGAT
jgi:ankyrin repeat protein